MRISRADVKSLGLKRLQPTKEPGEILALFVPGKLTNTKNGGAHYFTVSHYKKGWREKVAYALLETGWRLPGPPGAKRVHFLAHVVRGFDQDGLRVALAPVLDGLGECGVLTGKREATGRGDDDSYGHVFDYEQKIEPTQRGVVIRVSIKP